MVYFRFLLIFSAILSSNLVNCALTANKVWFEFHPGFYRVFIQYTVPALREIREASVDFKNLKKAEIFYFKILRGAEFELGSPDGIRFVQPRFEPDPW